MLTSGVNAGISTASDTAVTLITVNSQPFNRAVFINTGNVAGFVSIDGGSSWVYLPASTTAGVGYVEIWHKGGNGDIKLQRFAGGSNVTGVYCFLNQAE